jgi:hypothetical protein
MANPNKLKFRSEENRLKNRSNRQEKVGKEI